MKIVEIQGLAVQGLAVRTCNADEAAPATARIGPLWADFGAKIAPRMAPVALVYGVYHHYASDADGLFDVLVGSDALLPTADKASALAHVDIAPGSYLVWEAQGAMPQAVIGAWARIWHYFADPQCPHHRAYTTDFERYGADGGIEIFIAMQKPGQSV